MLCNGSKNCGIRLAAFPQIERPISTRMQSVPLRAPLIPTPSAWIIVAKPVYDDIPERLILGDQHLFRQSNPHRIKNQPATREVGDAQVLRSLDRPGVVSQSLVER